VSPEKLCSDKFVNLLRSLKIPFGFACIDEAHCVSEWSHNFRPSYLRLQHVLQSKLGIKTILAMTATATKRTEVSICQSLNIPSEGVVRCSVIRPNLHLNASLAEDRHLELVKLLNSKPFSEFNSIIIYCMLQRETDELAGYLQMKGFDAASYHAGKTPKDRKRVQDQFTKNKVRIIVATVAFGMGLDKPDVRGVIHFSLPKSPENYIQVRSALLTTPFISNTLAYLGSRKSW
jgi:ATP-dependent DNA helicase Q4